MAPPREEVLRKCEEAKRAADVLALASTDEKNRALFFMADGLEAETEAILEANARDVEQAKAKGTSKALIDRLTLTEKRVAEMAAGLREVAALPDPVGEAVAMFRRPNGLDIAQVRVPLGVVGIIYEARPNVTADAAGLCLKAGNAVVLRGGSDALQSNREIVRVLKKAIEKAGLPPGSVSLIEDTTREAAAEMMRMHGYIDVLIPRGGAGLIKAVVENATVPVIETGVGNCHAYVDASADLDMAENIIINGKCQRPAVCNALESLLIHKDVAQEFVPRIVKKLQENGVEVRGDERVRQLCQVEAAVESDWATEFLDLIIAVKVVDSLDEAIAHINRYGTKHSETIITRDYAAARRFLQAVDAAAVYANASTRFTDGGQFGLGAEIGISTQKLHARGPMGLRELTSTKFIIYGDGQIRE